DLHNLLLLYHKGNGEPKSVNIEGPGPVPLTICSKQTVTWTTTGFSADEPITYAILAEHNPTPPFIADACYAINFRTI
ncbi:16785_t:CDS:2, partial [Funneliformis mosseae]